MSGRWDSKGNEWTNLRFPNGFAHPFMSQSRDGSAHERMLVVIPKGVILSDGRNLGGWNLSVPASPWALMQKRTGRPVNIGLRSDQPVELFKGRGAKRQVISLASPEELRAALNEHRDRMLGQNTVRDKPAAIAYNVIPAFGQGAGEASLMRPLSHMSRRMTKVCVYSMISLSMSVSSRGWICSYPDSRTIASITVTIRKRPWTEPAR